MSRRPLPLACQRARPQAAGNDGQACCRVWLDVRIGSSAAVEANGSYVRSTPESRRGGV